MSRVGIGEVALGMLLVETADMKSLNRGKETCRRALTASVVKFASNRPV
jgi:hypothetical protein